MSLQVSKPFKHGQHVKLHSIGQGVHVLGIKVHIICIHHVFGQAAAAVCGLTCGHGTVHIGRIHHLLGRQLQQCVV